MVMSFIFQSDIHLSFFWVFTYFFCIGANHFATAQKSKGFEVDESSAQWQNLVMENVILACRNKRGLTLLQAEAQLGIHHDTIWRHEHDWPCNSQSMMAYHLVWGIPLEDLIKLGRGKESHQDE
jgi:hypothetical protein